MSYALRCLQDCFSSSRQPAADRHRRPVLVALREGPVGGAMPPTPVELVTLAPAMVEDTSEFVGTVKSRQTSTVQPQVEGFLTRIAATSGSRVQPGTVLFEIDSTS